ncbi:MAG TPA: hypothetical protein VJ898_15110 [Natrialbaceae archaeon]|nr:hypothetical protein [Natrialbaceae archaeon]
MASMDFGDATDPLAIHAFRIDAVMIFVGYFGTTLAVMPFEGVGPDLSNELSGVGVACPGKRSPITGSLPRAAAST